MPPCTNTECSLYCNGNCDSGVGESEYDFLTYRILIVLRRLVAFVGRIFNYQRLDSYSSRADVLTNNSRYCDIDTILSSERYLVHNGCRPQCRQAHSNLIEVVKFIEKTVKHQWQPNIFLSNINWVESNINGRHWNCAGWHEDSEQAFFGQHLNNEGLCSCATALDIVTHEFFHGVSIQTANLAYERESGALDESYCDIFGILLLNFKQPDISQWQWKFGRGFGEDGMVAIRDLSQPAQYSQPEVFEDFHYLEDDELPDDRNDFGYVHYNSGIHNKAAYELLTSTDATNQDYLFDAHSGAKLFYSALNRLAETSSFMDSYLAVKKAAKTLFRSDSDKQDKLKAIDNAFASVGIIEIQP